MDTNQTILIDMDGVLADWELLFDNDCRRFFPQFEWPEVYTRTTFDLTAGISQAQIDATYMVMDRPGFYVDLQPLPGAGRALNEMVAAGFNVVICTSPTTTNATCASDKLNWMNEHIGQGWADRTIITKDKTLVRGDILIDDKPDIHGSMVPTWEQVLFTQSYNTELTDRRRLDRWEDWPTLFETARVAA